MKKILLLLIACLFLTACAPGMEEKAPSQVPDTSAALRVEPLPAAIDPENLTDCTVHVSLGEGDAYVDDTGVMRMKLTVCASDLYDMTEVSRLKEGDTIVIRGMDVLIRTLEAQDTGGYAINGGYSEGGFTLYPDDGGTLYEIGPSDARFYQTLGEATLRVSEDFIFTDSADLEQGERTFYPGDFLTEGTGIDYRFVPANTTVVIQNGIVVSMHRVYIP